MSWYRVAETSADKASLLLADISYYPAFLETLKITGQRENFASYIDKKNNVVSEFMATSDRDRKALFGYTYFLSPEGFADYKKDIQTIIHQIDEYKNNFDKINLDNISLRQIIPLFEKGRILYHKSLGLYLISQPEYTAKLEEQVEISLLKFVPRNKLKELFIILTAAQYGSCLERERLDWLQAIALPAAQKYKNIEQAKEDKQLTRRIASHISKYKYYSAGAEFDLWDVDHYLKLLKHDLATGSKRIGKELLGIRDKERVTKNERARIIKKYKLDPTIVKATQIISALGMLRINLRVLGWQFFNYLFPLLLKTSAKRLNVRAENLGDMSYHDYIKVLKGKLSKSAVPKRKNRNSLIILDKNIYQIYQGGDADRKYNKEIKQEIKREREIQGTVAYGKGIVRGKVFLFKWGSRDVNERIYAFPKNFILVAGQTKPLLTPAIRKAKAIITDEGGLLCHAAIVSRELRIPCIVGTQDATQILKDNDSVEIDMHTGIIKIIK